MLDTDTKRRIDTARDILVGKVPDPKSQVEQITIALVTTMAQTIQREPAFLRRKQVETRTGLSRSTIYQYINDGVFPKPVPLGPRAVGWLESDVSEWIAGRVKIARDGSRQMA